MSKIGKLLVALEKGASLTSKQISARFGLKNPSAAISSLRKTGHSIRLDRSKTNTSYFRLGRTSRRSVASGPQALNGN